MLARVLVPRDFGLIAMIAVFTGFAGLFVDLGLSSALVQRPEIEDRHLSSALYVNLGMGAVTMLVTIAIAPAVAAFYHQPRLLLLMVAGAPTFLIASLAGVQTAVLERELHFRKLAVIENAAFLSGNTVAVVGALAGLGVWSFVVLVLVTSAVRTVALWATGSWRPAHRLDRQSVADLWKFSSHLTGFSAVNYWSRNADNLLLGRYVGTTQLAFYDRAYTLMLAPISLVWLGPGSRHVSRVLRIQGDLELTRRVYLRSLGLIGLVVFPTVVGIFTVAKPFILSVYGPNWQQAVVLVQILSIPCLTGCFFQATGWVFTSQGRTDLMLRISIVWSVAVVLAFIVGLHWGVRGVATAYAGCNVLMTVPAFSFSGRLIGVSLADVARAVAGVAAASVVMGGVVLFVVSRLVSDWGPAWQLALAILTGVGVYSLVLHVTSPAPYVEFRQLLTEFRRSASQAGNHFRLMRRETRPSMSGLPVRE